MSSHNETQQPPTGREGFFRRHWRKATVGGVLSTLGITGAAIATVVLTTAVTGSVSINEQHVSDNVRSVKVTGGAGITCSVSKQDAETFAIDATLVQVVGENGQKEPARGGYCNLTVVLKNNGDLPVKATGAYMNAPEGWSLELRNTPTIEPSKLGSVQVRLTAAAGADQGNFEGGIETTYE